MSNVDLYTVALKGMWTLHHTKKCWNVITLDCIKSNLLDIVKILCIGVKMLKR